MTPELREFVLSLPVEVRRELLQVKETIGFYVWAKNVKMRADHALVWSFDIVLAPFDDSDFDTFVCVPINVMAIIRHAAEISGRRSIKLSSYRDDTEVCLQETPATGVQMKYAGSDEHQDYKAAIGILRDVMASLGKTSFTPRFASVFFISASPNGRPGECAFEGFLSDSGDFTVRVITLDNEGVRDDDIENMITLDIALNQIRKHGASMTFRSGSWAFMPGKGRVKRVVISPTQIVEVSY